MIDAMFLDGSDDYLPPPDGAVGSVRHGGTVAVIDDPLSAVSMLSEQVRPGPDATLIALRWHGVTDGPLTAGSLRTEATVTSRGFGSADDSTGVVVEQDARLIREDGTTALSAQLGWRVSATEQPDPDVTTDEIGSPAWGQVLAQSLAADPEFASSTATLDGSIGITSTAITAPRSVEFRIYRGAVVECGRKSLDGPTFVIEADPLTWTELVTGRFDEYVRFAARSRFTVRGSGFQYLRLNRTSRIMVHHARTLRQDAARRIEASRG